HPPQNKILDTGGVAIFWDYDSVVQQFGGIKLFKAYADLSVLSSPRSLALRSELQCSGVSLIDCPHNGRKNVVDQTIIVILNSGYVGICHGPFDVRYHSPDLWGQRFRIRDIYVALSHVQSDCHGAFHSSSLRAQASVFIDWNSAVLNVLKDERLQYEGPLIHNGESEVTTVKPLVQPSPPHESNTVPPDKAPFVEGDSQTSPLLSLPSPLSPPMPEEEGVCEETSCEGLIAPALATALPECAFLVDPSSSGEFHDPVTVKSPSHIHSAPPDTPDIDPPYSETTHFPAAVTLCHEVVSPTPSGKLTWAQIARPSSTLLLPSQDCTVSTFSGTSPINFLQDQGLVPLAEPRHTVESLTQGPIRDTDNQSIVPPSSIELHVPAGFRLLVEILQRYQEKGIQRASRSQVAVELVNRDSAVYRNVGVLRFREYSALASSAKLIALGGVYGDAWIALHPELLTELYQQNEIL
ncbi:hypothetical protein WG66_007190, partial [Moniliophthora roreri]